MIYWPQFRRFRCICLTYLTFLQAGLLSKEGDLATRKRFSEKTIVAFTNSTVFLLDFYIYMIKPISSHLPGSMSPDYRYLHARQMSHQLGFPFQTVSDCIRYIIGVFCCNFKSQMNKSCQSGQKCQSCQKCQAEI